MCHTIDSIAQRPRIKYAYKVVEARRGGLFSLHNYARSTRWEVGKTVRAKGLRSYGCVKACDSTQSAAGIYVYTLLAKARSARKRWPNSGMIIKVAVDPKDWLTTALFRHEATYRKATMVAVVK